MIWFSKLNKILFEYFDIYLDYKLNMIQGDLIDTSATVVSKDHSCRRAFADPDRPAGVSVCGRSTGGMSKFFLLLRSSGPVGPGALPAQQAGAVGRDMDRDTNRTGANETTTQQHRKNQNNHINETPLRLSIFVYNFGSEFAIILAYKFTPGHHRHWPMSTAHHEALP